MGHTYPARAAPSGPRWCSATSPPRTSRPRSGFETVAAQPPRTNEVGERLMPIDPSVAIGADLGRREFSWSSSDVLLYHLGIGAGARAGDQPRPGAAALDRRPRRASRCCRRSAWSRRRSTRPRRRRWRCPACRSASSRSCTARSRSPCTRRSRPPGRATQTHDAHRRVGQGQGRGDLAGGHGHLRRRRRPVDHPLVDLRARRGRLRRRPRYVGAGRAPRP